MEERQKRYSHPIVTVDEERNQLPTVFATATFAFVKGRFFMVTPAHALENKNGKPVYLGIDPKAISLAYRPIIKQSQFDIAAVELLDDEVDQIHEWSLWVTHELLRNSNDNFQCVLEGYPANKNKMKTRKHKIEFNLLNIVLYNKPKSYFPDKNYNKIINFIYSYDEKMLSDGSGEKMQPRHLAGMSGGMFKKVYAHGLELPLGIFLAQDKRKKALVGLDYSFVLAWLEANFDEFDERSKMIEELKKLNQ